MKVKAMTGSGFRGLITYMSEKRGSSFVCGSQPTKKDFLRECAALRSARADCSKPVLHFSLSQPPGERLSDLQWEEAVDKFMLKMGLEGHSFFCMRHSDTDHDHVHICINKIGPGGKLWDTQKSALRAQKVTTQIEKEMGQTATKTLADHRRDGKDNNPISSPALRQFERTGTLPLGTKKRIAERIKSERTRANRAAHFGADQDHGGLVDRPPSNPEKNHGTGRKNQDAGETPHRLGSPSHQHLSANAEITAALKKGASNGKTSLGQRRPEPRRAFTTWHAARTTDHPGIRTSTLLGPERMPNLRAERDRPGQQQARDALLLGPIQGYGGLNSGLHGLQPGGGITSKNAASISP